MYVASVTNHADGVVHVDGKPAYKVVSFIGGGNAGRVHSVSRLEDGKVRRFRARQFNARRRRRRGRPRTPRGALAGVHASDSRARA